jgi:enoyl reductase-like protein
MTYIELVNSVLRRLRESEATTVQGTGNSNSYARLIGDFVNEAKSQVENAWKWSALRRTLTATTVDSTFNYEIQGSQNNFQVLSVLNDTSDIVMLYKDADWFNEAFLLTNPQRGIPTFYNFNGVSANGDTQVDIYPIPDGAYTLRFNVVLRNTPLSNDSDNMVIPSRPVILLATAMAIEERGEDGGQQSANAYRAGMSALADAISLDAGRHPEETVWYSV